MNVKTHTHTSRRALDTSQLSPLTVIRTFPDGAAVAIADTDSASAYIPSGIGALLAVELGSRVDGLLVTNRSEGKTQWFVKHATPRDDSVSTSQLSRVEELLATGGVWEASHLAHRVLGSGGTRELAAVTAAAEAAYAAGRSKGLLVVAGKAVRTWYTTEATSDVDLDVFEEEV